MLMMMMLLSAKKKLITMKGPKMISARENNKKYTNEMYCKRTKKKSIQIAY